MGNEDQDLLQNLALTQTVLRGTVADDTEGVAWAKLKIGKLRASIDKTKEECDSNEKDIGHAQEEASERDTAKGYRKKLLSSLVHDHGIDTMTEDTSLTEESD